MCVCVLDLYVCLFSTPFHLPCFCCSFLFTFGGRRALFFHAPVSGLCPVRFLRTCSGSDAFVPNDFLLAEFGASRYRLRFFRHFRTADPKRMLSVIFRWRCALVRRGQAQLSVCNGFMSLLDRYKRLDVWLHCVVTPCGKGRSPHSRRALLSLIWQLG